MHRSVLVVALLALISGLALWLWQASRAPDPTPVASAATVLQDPRPLPAFALVDQNGQPFGLEQLRNRWSLLFFGFTRCPDICPNTLGLLHAINNALGEQARSADFQVVFVSVDPQYDSPKALKSYVEYFDPAFVAATGPEAELHKLTGALYMPYQYVPVGDADDYTVEHSGALVLLDPQGRAVAYFSPPLQVGPIADDLGRLLKG